MALRGLLRITGGGTVLAVDSGSGRLLWTHRFDGHESHPYWADTGVAHDRNAVYLAEKSGTIRAHDRRNGRELWRSKRSFDCDHAFIAADAGQNVYVSGYSSGQVDCFNARTGARLWTANHRGLLYASAGFVAVGEVQNQRVTRLDPATGRELWSVTGPSWIVGRTPGLLFCSNWNNETAALRESDGVAVWKHARSAWTAALVGDTLILGGYYAHVTALDWKTGRERWTTNVEGLHAGYSAVSPGDCLVIRGWNGQRAHCLDLKTGVERFAVDGSANRSYHNMATVFRGHSVFVSDRMVRCVRSSDGTEVWRRGTADPAHGVLWSGCVLVLGTSTSIEGLRTSDGRPAWSIPRQTSANFYARVLD